MSKAPVVRRRGSRDLTANHKRLYQFVRRAGQISRADLTRQSGLTFPSISRIVADLIAADVLRTGASRRGGMGKPPVDLTINPDHAYSLGIYLDGDAVTGRLVNALGEALTEVDFPTASFSEGIRNALAGSRVSPDRLTGVCFSSSGELLNDAERGRLAEDLSMSVFAVPAIAASVRAERYFGSASELGRFIYFDAPSLELGAVVNGTVLARPGTLSSLLGVQRGKSSGKKDVLPDAIRGAASLVQAEVIVVGGLSAEDLKRLEKSIGDLPLAPSSAQASDPALAAAAVPLDETFGT